MHVTPAPARTDVSDVSADVSTSAAQAPAEAPSEMSRTAVRRAGVVLALGGLTWSIGSFFNDITQINGGWYAPSTLAFQIGLLMLLRVQTRTRATGTGRLARGFMVLEHVLVFGAIISTLNDIFLESIHGTAVWAAFDAFWPLSMLGMLAIGVRIAIAGRWRGIARGWPLIAESWAVVVIPAVGVSAAFGSVVSGVHLLLGYTALGLILALRPDLVTPRG